MRIQLGDTVVTRVEDYHGPGFDEAPAEALQARLEMLADCADCADRGTPLLLTHFSEPHCCRIHAQGNGGRVGYWAE